MIKERRQGALVVFEQRPGVVAALIALCALIMVALGLSGWFGISELDQPSWFAIAIGLVLAGCLVAFFGIERAIFDCDRREIRWSKRKLFRHRSGRLSFDEVAAVTLETLSSSESVPAARVVLLTETGKLALTDHYSGSPLLWRPILERIEAILDLGSEGSLEESLRSLMAQGRKIDAIRLLRSERSLSLEEAKAHIDKL